MMLEFISHERRWVNNGHGPEEEHIVLHSPFILYINPDCVTSVALKTDRVAGEYVILYTQETVAFLRTSHQAFRHEYWRVFGLPNPNPTRYPEDEEEDGDDVDEPEYGLVNPEIRLDY